MEIINAEDILRGIASQFVVYNKNICPDCGILMSLRIHYQGLKSKISGVRARNVFDLRRLLCIEIKS